MSFTRLLPLLRELSEAIANVSHGVDALCELLGKTDTGQVHAQSVYLLLEPLPVDTRLVRPRRHTVSFAALATARGIMRIKVHHSRIKTHHFVARPNVLGPARYGPSRHIPNTLKVL
jgi:hypothetical protein